MPASAPSSSGPHPTTRSRTLLFLSYRDSTARSSSHTKNPFLSSASSSYGDAVSNGFAPDDEHERLISHEQPGHIALNVDLPPRWVDISDQVHDMLAATQQKISVLERLHAKHVLPGFADRSAEEREIEAVTTDITRDFRRCHSLIQSISEAADAQGRHAFPPRSSAHHEKLAAQNLQRALAAKVQELSAAFRKKQRVYLETLQGHAIKNQDLLVASGAVTLKGSEATSDLDEDLRIASQNRSSSFSSRQLQEQIQDEGIDDALLQRDREITEIAKSISTLAELFKDLSTMVIDQGTLLDSVEYNIEQTAYEMQEAMSELKFAEGYQRNTGRRKCIFLLLLIIFGLVVVLIFKPKRTRSISTTPTEMLAAKEGEQLPPIPVDVTTLNPDVIGLGDENEGEVGESRSSRSSRRSTRENDQVAPAPKSRLFQARIGGTGGIRSQSRARTLARTRARRQSLASAAASPYG